MEWQNELFRVGLIHRLHKIGACEDKKRETLEFDYIKKETVDGKPRVFAYFSKYSQAAAFKISSNTTEQEIAEVGASSVERTSSTPRDYIDHSLIPDYFFSIVDDVNKPEAGSSPSGKYYRIDITEYLNLSDEHLTIINTTGHEGANCFGAALYFSGVTELNGRIDPNEVFPMLNTSNIYETADKAEPKPGDVVVWYRMEGKEKLPVHAFIDIGYGWALTKNGAGEYKPYRFQKIEHMRHLYSQTQGMNKINIVDLREVRYRPEE
jgi:hypothetical protein